MTHDTRGEGLGGLDGEYREQGPRLKTRVGRMCRGQGKMGRRAIVGAVEKLKVVAVGRGRQAHRKKQKGKKEK